MSFWEHLEALRSVLLRIVAVVLALSVGAFVAMPWIFENIIMAPCHPDFWTYRFFNSIAYAAGFGDLATDANFTIDVVSLELASQLFTHISAAGWTALVAGFPIVIFLLWTFIAPGLLPHERRGATRSFVCGNIMFYLGVAVGYFLVFPLALRFLGTYSISETIRPIVSLSSYMDNFFAMLLCMGVVFELPLIAWLLGRVGVLHRSFFKKYRRHAIVLILIISALITPTGDPFTLAIVFIPVYCLWEASARLVPAKEKTSNTD